MVFSVNGAGSIGYPYGKKLILTLPHTVHLKKFQVDYRATCES